MPLLLLLLLLIGCSHECPDSFKEEAAGVMRTLIEELVPVKTSAELFKKQKKIKRMYTELSDLSIKARIWQESHPNAISCERHHLDENLSEALKRELERVYKIDGAREIMEEAQKEAIEHLDEFESRSIQRIERNA
jgi:hypothetical protein